MHLTKCKITAYYMYAIRIEHVFWFFYVFVISNLFTCYFRISYFLKIKYYFKRYLRNLRITWILNLWTIELTLNCYKQSKNFLSSIAELPGKKKYLEKILKNHKFFYLCILHVNKMNSFYYKQMTCEFQIVIFLIFY